MNKLLCSIVSILFLFFRVCGLIVPQADMPFSDLGLCPDIVSSAPEQNYRLKSVKHISRS